MANKLVEAFGQFFEAVPANTKTLREVVFKLRYQVYCVETGFEDPNDHAGELEMDSADLRSVYYLIRHRASRRFAATTRLVLPEYENIDNPFPIEEHCRIENRLLLDSIPRQNLGEVSRFCVSKEFKRRSGEAKTLAGISESSEEVVSKDERRVFPHITLALIACLVSMSREHNITHWFAVMEPALLRFLARLGIHFIQIGPRIDYHGIRQPGIAKVEEILAGARQKDSMIGGMFADF